MFFPSRKINKKAASYVPFDAIEFDCSAALSDGELTSFGLARGGVAGNDGGGDGGTVVSIIRRPTVALDPLRGAGAVSVLLPAAGSVKIETMSVQITTGEMGENPNQFIPLT